MFRVTLPSSLLYVTPEQLPYFLATLAETKYVAESGEFRQTVTQHEYADNFSTAVIAINQLNFQELWVNERTKREKLEARLAKKKSKRK